MWLSVLHLIQDSVVLRSYNSHNDYMMQMSAFNSLHDEFYNKQIYDMLDELQVSVCVCGSNSLHVHDTVWHAKTI